MIPGKGNDIGRIAANNTGLNATKNTDISTTTNGTSVNAQINIRKHATEAIAHLNNVNVTTVRTELIKTKGNTKANSQSKMEALITSANAAACASETEAALNKMKKM